MKEINVSMKSIDVKIPNMVKWCDQGIIAACADGKENQKLKQSIKKTENNFVKMEEFVKQQKRYAWVGCRGILVQYWSRKTMRKMGKINGIGERDGVFEEVGLCKNLDRNGLFG